MYVFRRYGWGVTYRAPIAQEHALDDAWSNLRTALFYTGAIMLLFSGMIAVYNLRAAAQSAEAALLTKDKKPSHSVPVASPPQRVTPTVQEVLNAWVVSHPTKKWGIAVSSLGSDKISAAVNGGLQFNTASVYKLLLTYPLFQKYNLDSLSQSPYKNCLDLMIKISDNSCGEAIGYGLGWTKATQALRQAGLTSTDLYTSRGPVTTAGDVNRFLTKFYTGELMGNPEKQYVMGLMQLQKYRKGIPTGCSSCVVSDKIGDLGYVRHDVGIVEYKSGAFALTILSNGASYSQIAELTAQIYSSIVDH